MDDLFERIRQSVASQAFMAALGVTVVHVAPGEVDLRLPFDDCFTQHHGLMHGGAVAAVLDSACGHAAMATPERDVDVLTIEYKINLLEAVVGDVLARGRVVRRGGRITVCHGEAWAGEILVATSTTTMSVRPR